MFWVITDEDHACDSLLPERRPSHLHIVVGRKDCTSHHLHPRTWPVVHTQHLDPESHRQCAYARTSDPAVHIHSAPCRHAIVQHAFAHSLAVPLSHAVAAAAAEVVAVVEPSSLHSLPAAWPDQMQNRHF